MLDELKDIIKHVHSLGCIEVVKFIGTATDAKIEAKDADNTVIIYGTMNKPLTGLESTVGFSRLGVLKSFIGMHEGSDLTVVNDDKTNTPSDILFDNKAEFTSTYRFMSETMVNEQVKVPPFKGATWDVVITPNKASIALMSTASGSVTEKRCIVFVEKGTLKFAIGEGPTDKVTIPFEKNVTGTLKHKWTYPVSQILSILKLTDSSSTATMSFSDMGALKIDIDSGIGKYTYIIPAGRA